MIRSLRTTHRWGFVLLAIALPAVMVTAIISRHPEPATAAVFPSDPAVGAVDASDIVTEIDIVYLGKLLTARIGEADGKRFLVVTNFIGAPIPDLQLYWSPAKPGPGGELPGGVVRFGTLSEADQDVFAVPEKISVNTGWIILFNLADGETVASAPFSFR